MLRGKAALPLRRSARMNAFDCISHAGRNRQLFGCNEKLSREM